MPTPNSHFFKYLFFVIFINLFYSIQAVPTVIVSVAPYKFFVNKIAGETVDVYLMVPAGASSHTYEPTPRQMMQASQADLWFSIGESFEKRAMQALQSHQPKLRIIDLQKGLDLIRTDHTHGCKGCCPGCVDLHFWLSARQAQIQAKTIADALIQTYPGQADMYQANLLKFQQELQTLDQQITTILAPLKNRNIVAGHPAYAYFCRDYQLNQYSIESEGRDPTPQQMTKLLNLIRSLGTKTIFVQMQYNNKAAQLIAKEVNAKIVTLDPYAESYLKTMLEIAHAFAAQ